MNPVKRQAGVHATREKIPVETLPARALDKVADIEVKTMSVLVGHGHRQRV
ncbi:hypothetical protein DESC_280005 [Desulfosarcina cetonica]|nr:hypothetical protein DESC_280005 [Desulfosarcina cetonica]